MKRRQFLHTVAVGTAIMGGCVSDGSTGQGTTSEEDRSTTSGSTPTTQTETTDTSPTGSHPSPSSCRETATTKGTAIYEAAPPDFSIENTTTTNQIVTITVSQLPDDVTPRTPDEAPHEVLGLSEQSTVFSTTTELSAGTSQVYRCTGMNNASDELQIAVEVQNGPVGAFDWNRAMGPLNIDLKSSSVQFSVQGR